MGGYGDGGGAAAPPSKMRWADTADDDELYDDEEEDVLPEPQVFGPDDKGVKTIIEYKYNDEGLKVRITKKVRVKKQTKKLSKGVIARRQWAKFGEAKMMAGQKDNLTMVSTEEIYVERTGTSAAALAKQKEQEAAADPLAALAAGANASLIVCRTCGKKGDHWTSKCPYKDLAARGGFGADKDTGEDTNPPGAAGGSLPPAGAKSGGYVPPSMRAGARVGEGESMRRGRDDNSIRVTNLSEDTREQDLQELFRPFGPITRIYVAFDRDTGLSRGFAFINFVNRDDALRAIKKLNGYGYDNLILRVEWAAPREEKKT
eukprot:jgi/Chlat1/770/Chrsp104S01243